MSADKEQELLKAVAEWRASIAFYSAKRGYVCYSVATTQKLQEQLLSAAYAYAGGRVDDD